MGGMGARVLVPARHEKLGVMQTTNQLYRPEYRGTCCRYFDPAQRKGGIVFFTAPLDSIAIGRTREYPARVWWVMVSGPRQSDRGAARS